MISEFLQRVAQLLFVITIAAGCGLAQTELPSPSPDDKAEKIIQKAILAVGGEAYLKAQTVVGRGFFTEYRDGSAGVPLRFIDYLVYPDRERTEFSGGGNRSIQTNDREKGWLFDAAAQTLKDQTPQQVAEFRNAMRTSMENLLRGWWRKDGATLSYVGRREASLGRRNETVRLTYPDGFWIEFEFAATDGVPAKILYKRSQKNPDTEEVEEIVEEDRLYRFLGVNGISAPYVIDHFRNGKQTSRINYESIEFNKPVPESLFTKPASIKAVK